MDRRETEGGRDGSWVVVGSEMIKGKEDTRAYKKRRANGRICTAQQLICE